MVYGKPRRQQGIALVLATVLLSSALLLLGIITLRVTYHSRQTDFYEADRECFYGVETAFARSVADVEALGPGMIGLGTWTLPGGLTTITSLADLPTFDDSRVTPETLAPTMPGVSYMAYVVDWTTDNFDNNGDGVVDGPEELDTYTVYALAHHDQGVPRRVAEGVYRSDDVNVWRNAIFGGTGQSGGLINGNVSIHGSVHLLGDDILQGGVAVAALDMSGTSLIHNNYVGLDPALGARIPPLQTRDWNGELVETLNARLRVRRGQVGMSGNSEIGEPDTTGNGWKETMDGVYVTDGWTGNSVVNGDPTKLFSDNGWDSAYDLGSRVPFPSLDDDWRDPLTGETVVNPGTGANYTHTEYFQQVLSGTAYTPPGGTLTISTKQDFYYNASRPGDPNPANRQPTDDYIYFTQANNRLQVNGQIVINGNLEIVGQGGDKTIDYTGRAAWLVNGDVSLDTNLLTVNPDGSTANSYPQNNALGIMAENNMVVGSTAQLTIMGAFYAENTVQTMKQTTILGTIVGDYFDMGTNVPDIYQVPTLADFIPLGMIGKFPILFMSQVSWRELGAEIT